MQKNLDDHNIIIDNNQMLKAASSQHKHKVKYSEQIYSRTKG